MRTFPQTQGIDFPGIEAYIEMLNDRRMATIRVRIANKKREAAPALGPLARHFIAKPDEIIFIPDYQHFRPEVLFVAKICDRSH